VQTFLGTDSTSEARDRSTLDVRGESGSGKGPDGRSPWRAQSPGLRIGGKRPEMREENP